MVLKNAVATKHVLYKKLKRKSMKIKETLVSSRGILDDHQSIIDSLSTIKEKTILVNLTVGTFA